MQTLMSVIRQFVAKQGHQVVFRGDSLRLTVTGPNGVWFHYVTVNEDDRWMICRSVLPMAIPPALRKSAALLITYFNDHLILGDFEMDLSDGEVAFKTSGRFTEDELSETMAEDLLGCNFKTFNRCLPGLMALIYGRRSVEQCYKMTHEVIEEPTEDQSASQSQLPPSDSTDRQTE